MKTKKSIPEVAKENEVINGQTLYQERFDAWLSLFKKIKKDDEIKIRSTREEIEGFIMDNDDLDIPNYIFIISYYIFINNEDIMCGLDLYFNSLNKAEVMLMNYRESPMDTKGTPFEEIWDEDNGSWNNEIYNTNWEGAYKILTNCLNYFSNIIPEPPVT